MSDVVVRVAGACGRITLNRPRAINALTMEMVLTMSDALRSWARDSSVHFIVLDGAGERGLCAGGDIRAMYMAITGGDLALAANFFREEYELNYRIARYPKPYVALMDGIVMGGGIGVSSHGSHRIVTERSQLAMPETSIGFITDIGGTYLLGTAPGEAGAYLGLTGNRIGATDAIFCNLADSIVSSERLPVLTDDLERCNTTQAMEDCLSGYAMAITPGELIKQRTWIDECFAASTVEEIFAALSRRAEPEAKAALDALRKSSPTSLKVTLTALRNARAQNDLAPCLRQEYRIALACTRGHDFVEGVRAALIDKDRHPAWLPERLEDVTPADVEQHFADSGFGDLHLAVDAG